MRPTIFIRCLVVVLILLAGALFVRTLFYAAIYDPDSGTQEPPQTALPVQTADAAAGGASVPPQDPSRLLIPALDINAYVQYVGVNAEGNIRTPDNFTDVAWYMYSAAPGEAGDAIIDGHVDNGLGLPGVFKDLSGIQIGDDVYVTTKGGTTLDFKVTDIASYPYQDVPMQTLLSQTTGEPLIRLMTCGGSWVSGGDTYDHRLVVTAALAS